MSSLHELLTKYSTHVYHIQHRVFRANHYAQGLIALHRMGASNDRLLQFTSWYLPTLEDANNFVLKDSNRSVLHLDALKGKGQCYNIIRDHFWNKLHEEYKGSSEDLIRHEFPALIPGLASATFHGTIHTGYGHSVGSPLVVCEGLAFLFHSYSPLVCEEQALIETRWEGRESSLEILSDVRKNRRLQEAADASETPEMVKNRGRFNTRIGGLLANHGTELISYANRFKLDRFSDAESVKVDLLHLAMEIFALCEPKNNFFLLHGVTCGWALAQILPLFESEKAVVKAVRTFLASLIGAYVSENSPKLDAEALTDHAASSLSWDEIKTKAMEGNKDEHILKVVQVCSDMATEFPENEKLYKNVSMICMSHPFMFTMNQTTAERLMVDLHMG